MKREVECINFGKWIKNKRKELGITQRKFAAKLGTHEITLSRYETGEQSPRLDIAEKIVSSLGAELVIREHG